MSKGLTFNHFLWGCIKMSSTLMSEIYAGRNFRSMKKKAECLRFHGRKLLRFIKFFNLAVINFRGWSLFHIAIRINFYEDSFFQRKFQTLKYDELFFCQSENFIWNCLALCAWNDFFYKINTNKNNNNWKYINSDYNHWNVNQ